MVTALWPIREDRSMEAWASWLRRTHQLNATMLSFLPQPFDAQVRAQRIKRAMGDLTCIVGVQPDQMPLWSFVNRTARMLGQLRSGDHAAYDQATAKFGGRPSWNWESPEMTNPHYVLLQASKLFLLEAARLLQVFNSDWFVWVDGGIGRHVVIPSTPWPDEGQMQQLSERHLHVGTWDGYGPIAEELHRFCQDPGQQFLANRNHLTGGVVVAPSAALKIIVPAWQFLLEEMIEKQRWNNEQVMFELLACHFPGHIAILETRGVLFRSLEAGAGALTGVSRNGQAAQHDICHPWSETNAILVPEMKLARSPASRRSPSPSTTDVSQLVILGIGKSGTSGVAQMVGMMNCSLGPLTMMHNCMLVAANQSVPHPIPPQNESACWQSTRSPPLPCCTDKQKANPGEYFDWERADVLRLNQRLLELGGASDWIGSGFSRQTLEAALRRDDGRGERKVLEAMRTAVADLKRHAKENGLAAWAMKEPRMCLTFFLWRHALQSPVCIIVFRHPAEVAASLATAKLSEAESMQSWEAYNQAALDACPHRVMLDYESLRSRPIPALTRLVHDLQDRGVHVQLTDGALKIAEKFQGLAHHLRRNATEAGQQSRAVALHREMRMEAAPLVASAYIELPNGARKHDYGFRHSLHVSARYCVFCSPASACERIRSIREAAGFQTETVLMDMHEVVQQLARSLGVHPSALWAAANASRAVIHCPSAEIVLLWLAKCAATAQTQPLCSPDVSASHTTRESLGQASIRQAGNGTPPRAHSFCVGRCRLCRVRDWPPSKPTRASVATHRFGLLAQQWLSCPLVARRAILQELVTRHCAYTMPRGHVYVRDARSLDSPCSGV